MNTPLMKAFAFIALFILDFFSLAVAQPYFDVAGITNWYIPGNSKTDSTSEAYATAFVSVPFNISARSKFIISPYYENRQLKNVYSDSKISLSSIGLPLTWRYENVDSSWSFIATLICRINASKLNPDENKFQTGGVFLNSFRINPKLKFKLGLYYNREFFANYFVPLVGIEYKMHEKWQLYGVIPNSIKLEYKVSKIIYTGAVIKSITNSYRYGDRKNYYKIMDNHAGVFADFYFPRNVCLMIEAGHTVLRNIKNRTDLSWEESKGNNFIFKAGIYYRLRFY